MNHPSQESRITARAGLWLLALTAFGAWLRFHALGAQSLWVDETNSVKYAAVFEPLTGHDLLENLHGPLHAVLLHAWSRLCGTSEAALRSLSALAGTLTIPLLYWAARATLPVGTSLLAAGLLAISPFHLWYSQEVRNYALFIPLVVLATGLFLRVLQDGGVFGRRYWTLLAATTAGFFMNLAFLFAAATEALTAAFDGPRTARFRLRLLSIWAVALLCLSPWIVRFVERRLEPSGALEIRPVAEDERLRGDTTSPLAGIPYAYFCFAEGYSLGPSLRELQEGRSLDTFRPHLPLLLLAATAFGTLFLWGAVRLFRAGGASRHWVLLAVLPVLCTYAVSTRNLKVFNPRYAAAAYPAFLVLTATGLASIPSRWGRWLLAAGVLIPTGASLAGYFNDPRHERDDTRTAVAELKEGLRPRDALFVIGTEEPLEHYYWRGIRNGFPDLEEEDLQRWGALTGPERQARFDSLCARSGRVFVWVLRPRFVDPKGTFRDWLLAAHPPDGTWRYPGVEVWRVPGGTR